MSDTIAKRILRSKKPLTFSENEILKEADDESEVEADEEYQELNADTDEEDYDDSTAPEQGNPEDYEEDDIDSEESEESEIDSDTSQEDDFSDDYTPSSSRSSSNSDPAEDDIEEPQQEEKSDSNPTTYENPLDNQYAINFTLGDEVTLNIKGDNSFREGGYIDGYDSEGFYRVRWDDGSMINGLTDIALKELVKHMTENKCVCGSQEFITEGNRCICDVCGRLSESASLLSNEDKKTIIRAEAHPMTTATKPSIAESIRKAFNSKSECLQESTFDRLKSLENEFWTKKEDLIADIEELGYTVEEIYDEYVVVSSEEDEDNVFQIYLDGTARTITLNFKRSRLL